MKELKRKKFKMFEEGCMRWRERRVEVPLERWCWDFVGVGYIGVCVPRYGFYGARVRGTYPNAPTTTLKTRVRVLVSLGQMLAALPPLCRHPN